MLKKTKLYVGISLVVEAVSSLVLFFIFLSKKKSIAGAFLALAAMSGAAGAYLICKSKNYFKSFDENPCCCDDDDGTCCCDESDDDDTDEKDDKDGKDDKKEAGDLNIEGNLFSREE